MSELIIRERLQAIMSKDPGELSEGDIVYLRSRRGYLTLTQQKRYAGVLDIDADQVDAGEADSQEEDESTESVETEDQGSETAESDESSEQDEPEQSEAEDVSGGEEAEEIDLMKLRRPELEELAAELGVENPAEYPNIKSLRIAIEDAYKAAE